MKKLLWLLYQPYKWLVFVPVLGISAAFFSITAVILTSLISPRAGSMFSGISWARVCSAVVPIFVKVIGKENIDRKQSYVVVSNHQSHFDIFVIYGWVFMDLKWVMKKELRKVPFLGWACEKIEFIYVDRSDNQKAVESLRLAKSKIKNGTSIIFFPEGTRSMDGEIARFKKGAFKMALDLQLPILPITIKGTRKILPSNTYNLLPGKAEMIIHEAISTDDYNERNIDDLIKKTRDLICDHFYDR